MKIPLFPLILVVALVVAALFIVNPAGGFFKVSAPLGRAAGSASSPSQEPVIQPELTLSTEKIYYFVGDQVNLTDPPSGLTINTGSSVNGEEPPLVPVRDSDLKVTKAGEPEYSGYIIQLEEEPVTRGGEIGILGVEQENKLERFEEIVPGIRNKVSDRFRIVFNGFAADITYDEAKLLENEPGVRLFKNYKVRASLMDSVPLIQADKVWELKDSLGNNITGKGTRIAIIDTGIDYTHSDLGGCFGPGCKVEDGWDFVNKDADPMDDNGHGTHCAGIAASEGELKGVAPNATLYAYKVLNSEGGGWDSDIIAAIERAVDPNQDGNISDHVDVISMSLGVDFFWFEDCYEVGSSLPSDNAVEAGVVVVAAAGNSGESGYKTIIAPACARKVIAVSASDKSDKIAYFSSKGPTKDFRIKPDVTAPGHYICSAQWDSAWAGKECYDNEHVNISGTSMATPHVAGTSALIIQTHPDWNPQEIEHSMKNTAVNIGKDILTQGYGRINALEAVKSKKPPIGELNITVIAIGNISIKGSAYGDNFTKYVLEYGEGIDPQKWTKISESTVPVIDDVLGSLDTTALKEEEQHILRLSVYGNTVSEDMAIFIPANDFSQCYSCLGCDLKLDITGNIVTLMNDIISLEDVCLTISANDVIFDCDNHHIIGNISQQWGIVESALKSYYTDNITVKNCNFKDFFANFGISSMNSNILNNTMWNSIFYDYMDGVNNILTDNKFYDHLKQNIIIKGYNQLVDTSNTIDGKPIYYFDQVSDIVIEDLDTYHLQVAYGDNVTITNMHLTNADPITFFETKNSTIKDSYISDSNGEGILLSQYSSGNLISNNTIVNAAGSGIVLYWHGNYMWNNKISGADDGIVVLYPENDIWENKIHDIRYYPIDFENIEEGDSLNIWHNDIGPSSYGYPSIFTLSEISFDISKDNQGNYWGKSSAPYFIPGYHSNFESVVDGCPYDQPYPPAEWPLSPVCPDAVKSMINNPTLQTVSGVLGMEAQKLDGGKWVTDKVILQNHPLTVPAKDFLAIDTIWNSIGYSPEDRGEYRAYAVFDMGRKLESSYDFDVYTKEVVECDSVFETDVTFTNSINCGYNGPSINADNIVINCDGYRIEGSGYGFGLYGHNYEKVNNVTIKNCEITEFTTGIVLKGNNNKLVNNHLHHNDVGVNIEGNYTDIISNTIDKPKGFNGMILAGHDFLVHNNTFDYFIAVKLQTDNSTIGNNIVYNNYTGFSFFDSDNNIIRDNEITDGDSEGIYFAVSNNNIITDNIITGNKNGMRFDNSWENNVSGNYLSNKEYGILLTQSQSNIFWNNTFKNYVNAEEDVYSYNLWNLSAQGNWWDDWSSNPGYPNTYKIPVYWYAEDFHPDGL
jgi:parallel beta-helix repeat protein